MLNTEVKTALKQSIAVCANISELKQNNYIFIFALQQNFAFIFAQKRKQCHFSEDFFCFLKTILAANCLVSLRNIYLQIFKSCFRFGGKSLSLVGLILSSLLSLPISFHPMPGICHEKRCIQKDTYMNCRTQKWFIPELDFFESPVLKGSSFHVIYERN